MFVLHLKHNACQIMQYDHCQAEHQTIMHDSVLLPVRIANKQGKACDISRHRIVKMQRWISNTEWKAVIKDGKERKKRKEKKDDPVGKLNQNKRRDAMLSTSVNNVLVRIMMNGSCGRRTMRWTDIIFAMLHGLMHCKPKCQPGQHGKRQRWRSIAKQKKDKYVVRKRFVDNKKVANIIGS